MTGGEIKRELNGRLYAWQAEALKVASSVHGRVQRRQTQRWAQEDQRVAAQQQTQAPAGDNASLTSPPASDQQDMEAKLIQLRQLGELRDSGILNDAEFEAKKAKILAG